MFLALSFTVNIKMLKIKENKIYLKNNFKEKISFNLL